MMVLVGVWGPEASGDPALFFTRATVCSQEGQFLEHLCMK
jgi:hypothetical protein